MRIALNYLAEQLSLCVSFVLFHWQVEQGGITIASGGLAVHQGGIQVLSSKVADILTLYMNSTNSFVGNVITVGGTQARVH